MKILTKIKEKILWLNSPIFILDGVYTGRKEEHGNLLNRMRRLGYEDPIPCRKSNFVSNSTQMSNEKGSKSKDSDEISIENFQLKEKIQDLEKQLKEAEIKAIAFSTMVDIYSIQYENRRIES